MESDKKIEEKKQGNAPFLAAFEYVRTRLSLTKGKMCELLNIKAPRLSEWDRGEKSVPYAVKCALVRISVLRNIGEISMDFLDGYTEIMLLENIPDDELTEIKRRRSNPDYDKLKARREEKENESTVNESYGMPTPSSMFNAHLAQQAESVEAFHIALSAKDEILKERNERIKELKESVAEKDARIEDLKEQIALLRAELNHLKSIVETTESGILKYPFKIGAADEPNIKTTRTSI